MCANFSNTTLHCKCDNLTYDKTMVLPGHIIFNVHMMR